MNRPRVPVTEEASDDSIYLIGYINERIRAEIRERYLDLVAGPRYGPPVPSIPEREPERCEHCGHILDDWWDE